MKKGLAGWHHLGKQASPWQAVITFCLKNEMMSRDILGFSNSWINQIAGSQASLMRISLPVKPHQNALASAGIMPRSVLMTYPQDLSVCLVQLVLLKR